MLVCGAHSNLSEFWRGMERVKRMDAVAQMVVERSPSSREELLRSGLLGLEARPCTQRALVYGLDMIDG